MELAYLFILNHFLHWILQTFNTFDLFIIDQLQESEQINDNWNIPSVTVPESTHTGITMIRFLQFVQTLISEIDSKDK